MSLTVVYLNNRNDQIFLDSLESASFAKEILIMDYQSKNDWQKLKKKYPQLRIIKKEAKIKDFAKARNEAIELVQTDYLFFLDSDEILTKASVKEIKKYLELRNFDSLLIKRVDYFHGKKVKWGELRNNYLLRIAKKENISFERQVHERALIKGNSKKTDVVIKHYAHQNLEEFFLAVNNYAQIEAKYRNNENWPYTKTRAVLEALTYPCLKFIYNYFFKLGFLDGFAGLAYATMMSLHSLLVRIYLYEKYFLS